MNTGSEFYRALFDLRWEVRGHLAMLSVLIPFTEDELIKRQLSEASMTLTNALEACEKVSN